MENLTLSSVYKKGEAMLKEAGVQDSDFDSLCLLEHFFSADRTELILHGDKKVDEKLYEKFLEAVELRKTGRPLQYIIGKWNFMGFDFYVGEGVLIPRDDTEIVVEAALEFLKNIEKPKVIDLCSGSGAIALSIAKLIPKSEVVALEYYDNAIGYLKKNIELNNASNVTVFKGDVTACDIEFDDESFDLVISNPPYIQSDEIDTLQVELQFEPRMALDGGKDGLYFYRTITEKWAAKVKNGGMLAYEVGEEQFEPVSRMLCEKGFENVGFKLDLQGYKRTVSGIKKKI
ncbi:MAG: peptide chain release factor N(5)-glutamine methyltransferase [Clostridia bacterium]|nr:peptide chain release factor N(5)-glutamine methyltransferase [Clostridia bacterium]